MKKTILFSLPLMLLGCTTSMEPYPINVESSYIFESDQADIDRENKRKQREIEKEKEEKENKELLKSIIKNPVNVNNAYKQLKRIQNNYERKDFETTADYQERINKINDNPDIFSSKEKYAFKIQEISIEYDPDDQKINLNKFYFCSYALLEGFYSCNPSQLETKKSYYRGSNAFGVSTDILKIRTKNFSLYVNEKHPLVKNLTRGIFNSFEYSFDLPIHIAKLINNKIDVFLVGNVLSKELIEHNSTYTSPKISNPKDEIARDYGVEFIPSHLVISRKDNGEIINIYNY